MSEGGIVIAVCICGCPYGGLSDHQHSFVQPHRIECPLCGIMGPGGSTEVKAIEHWNRIQSMMKVSSIGLTD